MPQRKLISEFGAVNGTVEFAYNVSPGDTAKKDVIGEFYNTQRIGNGTKNKRRSRRILLYNVE